MYKLLIEWTPEKESRMKEIVEKYLRDNGAHSGECVMQDDDCQINAMTLAADLADLIVDNTVY